MKNKKTRTFGTAADSYRTILRFQNSNAAIPPLRILFTLWVLCCGFVAAQSNDSSIISAARSNSTGSTSVSVPASSVYPALVNSSSDNVNITSTVTSHSLRNKTSILNVLHSSGFPIVGSTEPITLAISFVTTATPNTQSGAGSVRSLFDASSFSIPGFTEPLILAMFSKNPSSQVQSQSNSSLSSSSIISDFVSSAQSSSVDFGFSAYTAAPSLSVQSSSYIPPNQSTDQLSSNTVVIKSSPSKGQTDAFSSVFSVFKKSNTLLSMQISSITAQSTSTKAGSSSGISEALKPASTANSSADISHLRTTALSDSTSVTENLHSTQLHISSRGRSAVTPSSQTISRMYTSINAHLETSQNSSVTHYLSKTSDVKETVLSLLPGGTTPTVTVQHSRSTSPSIQDATTSIKHISSVDSSFQHTVNDSSAMDLSSSKRESNTSLGSFDGLNSSMTTMSYTSPLENPSSSVSSTSHSSMPLETSAIQASKTQLSTVINNLHVSSFSSVDSSESAGFPSSLRISLPSSSSSFSLTGMASNTSSKTSETHGSHLQTKTFTIFVTATQEMPNRSIILGSNTSTEALSYSDNLSYTASLESKSLVSTQLVAIKTKQLSHVSTVASLVSSKRISSVLTSPSKYIEPSISVTTNKSTFATQDLSVGSTAMLQSTPFAPATKTRLQTDGLTSLPTMTSLRRSSSSLNIVSTAHSLSTQSVGESSANHSVRGSNSVSGNNSFVDRTTTSSKFKTETPFLSSSGDRTDLPSLLQSTTLRTISTQISSSLGSVTNSTNTTDSRTISVSYDPSRSYPSQDLLHSTSKHLENATSLYADSATASLRTSPAFPVSNKIHTVTLIESSLSPTELFSNKTSSVIGSKSLSGNSSELSIIRTSFSVVELSSEILPTLPLSVTVSFSKSDSVVSELISQNLSSLLDSSPSSSSNVKQTSSKKQEVTLVTIAETSSRTTNQSVSVHESSSYLHVISSFTRTLSTSHARLSIATLPFGNSTPASSFPPPGSSSSLVAVSKSTSVNSSRGSELALPSSSKTPMASLKTQNSSFFSALTSSATERITSSLETVLKTSGKLASNSKLQLTPYSTQTVSLYTTMALVNSTMNPSLHSHFSSDLLMVTISSTVIMSSTQQVSEHLSQTKSLKTFSPQEPSETSTSSTNASLILSTHLNLSNTVLEYTSSKSTGLTVSASFSLQQSGFLSQISSLEVSRSLQVLTTEVTLNMSEISASRIQSLSEVSVIQTSYSVLPSAPSQVTTEPNKSLTQIRSLETSQTERLTLVNTSVRSSQVQTFSNFLVTSFTALSSASKTTISGLSSEGRPVNTTKSSVEQSRATPALSVSFQSVPPTQTTRLAASQTSKYTAVTSMNVSATPSSKGNLSSEFLVITTSPHVLESSLTGQSTSLTHASSRLKTSQNLTFTSRSMQNSLTLPMASLDMATTASSQLNISSNISIFSASDTETSTLIKPSPTEQFVSSSVITIPSGVFVRFAVNVSLSTNINNDSFKAQMKTGILATYENGSSDGTSGNITIEIISIAREPNDTKVNVTFKVVNVSASAGAGASAREPVLAYNVIQTMLRAGLRLGEAVGFQVVEEPAIFYPPSTSSFSTMVMMSTLSTSLKSINFTSVARESSAKSSFESSPHSTVNSTSKVYTTPLQSYLVTSTDMLPSTTYETSTFFGVTSLLLPATYISSSTTSLPWSVSIDGSSTSNYSKELTIISSSSVILNKTLFTTTSISFQSESSSFRETPYLSSVDTVHQNSTDSIFPSSSRITSSPTVTSSTFSVLSLIRVNASAQSNSFTTSPVNRTRTSAVTSSIETASSVIPAFTTVSLTQGASAFKSMSFNDISITLGIISPSPSSTAVMSNTTVFGSMISPSLSITVSANSTVVMMTKSLSPKASLPTQSAISQNISFLSSTLATTDAQVTTSSQVAMSNHSESSSQSSVFLTRILTSSYSVGNASETTLPKSSAIISSSRLITIAVTSSKMSLPASSSTRLRINSSHVETLLASSKISSTALSTTSFPRHSTSPSSVMGASQTKSIVYSLPLPTSNVSAIESGTAHVTPPSYSSEIPSSSVGTLLFSSAEADTTVVRVSTSISLLVNTTRFLKSLTSSAYNTAFITSNRSIEGSTTSSHDMSSSPSMVNASTTRGVSQVSTVPTVTRVNLTTEVTQGSFSLSSHLAQGSLLSPSRSSTITTLPISSAKSMTSLNGTQTVTRDLSSVTPAVTYAVSKSTPETLLKTSTTEKQFTTVVTSMFSDSLGFKSIRSTVTLLATYLTSDASVVVPTSTLLIQPSSSNGLITSTAQLQTKTTTESKYVLSSTYLGSVLTTESSISTAIPGTRSLSLAVTTDVVESSLIDTMVRHSVNSLLTSKSSFISVQATSYHSPASTIKVSSDKDFITLSPMTTSSVSKQVLFTSAAVLSSTETFITSRRVTLGSASITATDSSLETLPPMSVRGSMSSPMRDTSTSKKSSIATSLPQGSFSDLSSPIRGASSLKIATTRRITTLITKMETTTTKSLITSEKNAKATLVTETPASSLSSSLKTAALSTAGLLKSTIQNKTSITPDGSYSPSKTVLISASSTTELPTEPVRPTANANDTEGLVGIQILVPKNEDENVDSFREKIESRLAEAFRWGQRKGSQRKRRDLQHFDKPRRVHFNARTDFQLRKRGNSFQLDNERGKRFRREVDNITVLVETIRRAEAIVGEELVDIEYRVFNGPTMLSAESVVETMNRLSEAEMVSTLEYGVTLRPYVIKKTQTAVPTVPPTEADLDWATIIPAIAVSSAVLLFLLCACLWVRCAGRKKRQQKKVNPFKPKEASYENLEVKVQASHDPNPHKNPHSAPKVKRLSISSSSSSEDSIKGPKLPDTDYSPYVTLTKPNQERIKDTSKEVTMSNGRVKGENRVKRSKDTHETMEMEQLAGVIENIPQFRDEKLLYGSHGRQEKSLRYTQLPPLAKTPLVGKDPSDPEKLTELKKEKQRIIDESGVPQAWLDRMQMIELQKIVGTNDAELNEDEDTLMLKANVERWRNKMLHREKLRQDMREKEREKDKKLKRLEKEERLEPDKENSEDRPTTPRSLTAERKRRSRVDRWRKNKVGTSSSKGTSSSSSSSSSDSEEKKKDEKAEEKKRKQKEKEKRRKAKVPPLAIGQAAREAARETAWTIRETPGVRLVSVRPHNEGWQPQAPESTPTPVYEVPQTHQVSPRRQQRDRVHYLLETGYPVWPLMTTPLVQPEYPEEEVQYEDMEGLDPYIPQYDQEIHVNGDTIPSVRPPEPREAFGDSNFYDDEEHIYTEPNLTPASLPHTRLVNPRQNQTRPLIPTQYAHGYVARPAVSRGRPTSASQQPGASRSVGLGRPTSARTDPAMPRYAPSPLRSSPPNRNMVSLPGSRYLPGNRPTVANAAQPSIGTSPRYMVDPERRQEPPSSFDSARMILARAKSNLDRFEEDSRINDSRETGPPPTSEPVHSTPQKKIQPHAQPVRGQRRFPSQQEVHPIRNSRMEVSAREHAELEAQLLVSRALARARANVRA